MYAAFAPFGAYAAASFFKFLAFSMLFISLERKKKRGGGVWLDGGLLGTWLTLGSYTLSNPPLSCSWSQCFSLCTLHTHNMSLIISSFSKALAWRGRDIPVPTYFLTRTFWDWGLVKRMDLPLSQLESNATVR